MNRTTMKTAQLHELIRAVTASEVFREEVSHAVRTFQKESYQNGEDVTTVDFAFQRSSKVPLMTFDGHLTNQSMEMVEGIGEAIHEIIDHNMHQIINKQFINVVNQLLAMRGEMDLFIEDQLKRNEDFKQTTNREIETLKRKVTVQNTLANRGSSIAKDSSIGGRFNRTNGMIVMQANTSLSTISNVSGPNTDSVQFRSSHSQLLNLKAEVQKLKKNDLNLILKNIGEKCVYLEQKVNSELMTARMQLETIKQKTQKYQLETNKRLEESSVKQQVSKEVQMVVKGYLRASMDDLEDMRKRVRAIEQGLPTMDRNLQEYVCSQLRTVWMELTSHKLKLGKMEEQSGMVNDSFILDI